MTLKRKISVLDLTAAQTRDIELAVGLPVRRWRTEAVSDTDIYIRMLSAINGEPAETYEAMPFGELIKLVAYDDEAPNEGEEGEGDGQDP